MAIVRLEPFWIDDVTLGLIDQLRDGMSREEYFRRLLQGGLANALEELARTTRDYIAAEINHQTSHQLAGRKMLTLSKPPANDRALDQDADSDLSALS